MYKIPYDASKKSLYHPGEADDFFQFGFALTDEKALCAEMSAALWDLAEKMLDKRPNNQLIVNSQLSIVNL